MKIVDGFVLDSLNEEPIGKTSNFIWFITDIGIAALFRGDGIFKTYSLNVQKEAKDLSLDISKEDMEYYEIEDKKLFMFYS